MSEGATELQEKGLTLIHAYTLVITDLLSQCWENEEFQVTLISLDLITRASPPGTRAGSAFNEWLSSFYLLPSPPSAKS